MSTCRDHDPTATALAKAAGYRPNEDVFSDKLALSAAILDRLDEAGWWLVPASMVALPEQNCPADSRAFAPPQPGTHESDLWPNVRPAPFVYGANGETLRNRNGFTMGGSTEYYDARDWSKANRSDG